MSEGGMGAWKICPLFQGIGIASAVIVFLVNCDYNVLLSWAFYYFFASFTTRLPWSHCENDWNTPQCGKKLPNISLTDTPGYSLANTTLLYDNVSFVSRDYVSDPVTEFWEIKVLGLSDGIDEPGTIKWDLCLCLLLAWIVVYFCIWKGIKGSGVVMYFTVPAPYILLIILLVRGLTLDGAIDGIKFYLYPDFQKLLNFQVWADAGNQVFYSYSLSLGTLIALGSYNKFNHNSYRDCMLFACMNSFTSLLSGFVIFSVLGFMAKQQGVSVENVAESGPGLAFIAYPEAVAQMPLAPVWSVLFFLLLILLGLDSQFVGVEGLVTFVVDQYPHIIRKGYRREMVIAIICIISFLVGLSMVLEGGMYVFQLFDYYSVSRTIFVIAFIEMLVISYVYGIDRWYDNMELMFGKRITPAIKFCWMFLTPAFILCLFVVGVISYSNLSYERKSVTYLYPTWAIMIGWVMASASIIWIPVVAVYRLWEQEGSLSQRLKESIKPMLMKHQLTSKTKMEDIQYLGAADDDVMANASLRSSDESV
uniref:NTT4 n=1 Tax=Sinonovacula rivularis TaxID=489091 RepID=A0AA49X8Z1_9BIVA|nr:NTT4 [Sinonovacula rivularis]